MSKVDNKLRNVTVFYTDGTSRKYDGVRVMMVGRVLQLLQETQKETTSLLVSVDDSSYQSRYIPFTSIKDWVVEEVED